MNFHFRNNHPRWVIWDSLPINAQLMPYVWGPWHFLVLSLRCFGCKGDLESSYKVCVWWYFQVCCYIKLYSLLEMIQSSLSGWFHQGGPTSQKRCWWKLICLIERWSEANQDSIVAKESSNPNFWSAKRANGMCRCLFFFEYCHVWFKRIFLLKV